MRVVFDTNIFISALVIPGRDAERAMHRVIDGTDQLVISKQIIRETLSVLSRKFSRDQEALARVAVNLAGIAEEVLDPPETLHVLRDDADNRILECAVAGRASAIVTGDKQMLELREFKGIRIASLREYLSPDTLQHPKGQGSSLSEEEEG